MLGYLVLFVTPFAALALNVLLAWRIWANGGNRWNAGVLFAGPFLGLAWTVLSGVVTTTLPFGTAVYGVVTLLLYATVLRALYASYTHGPFRRHALLAMVFTVPAIVAVLAPTAVIYNPDPALLQPQ